VKTNQPSILVIDDDATQASVLKQCLQREESLSHVSVDVAADLGEFRECLSRNYYAAAVTDWHCPIADVGRAIVKELRSQKEGSAGGVVVLSAAVLDLRQEPLLQNDVLVLQKPPNGDFNKLVQFLADNVSAPVSPSEGKTTLAVDKSEAEPIIYVMFSPAFATTTWLILSILCLATISFCLWIFAGVAVIHPVGSLLGIVGGAGLLMELYLGIAFSHRRKKGGRHVRWSLV